MTFMYTLYFTHSIALLGVCKLLWWVGKKGNAWVWECVLRLVVGLLWEAETETAAAAAA